MFAEFAQLLVPGLVIFSILIIMLIYDYSINAEVIGPCLIVFAILYLFSVFMCVGSKYGLIIDPPEYTCPVGKVKFYNAGNVLCFDGEMAKEIRK